MYNHLYHMAITKSQFHSATRDIKRWLKKPSKKPKLLVVLGPTATGKSDFAVDIALHLRDTSTIQSEIISADSRQVYIGMNIGTGKILKKEMRGIPHHCLDIVSPRRKKMFSVAEFQSHATSSILNILNKNKLPILCGGTGFYIDSIVDGIAFPEVQENPALRKKLSSYSLEKLCSILEKLDKDRFNAIDKQNKVRLIRAIEIAKELGSVPPIQTISHYDIFCIGLDADDTLLKQKIHTRIVKRMKQGMVREAKRLKTQGLTYARMRKFGLEYAHLANILQHKISIKDSIQQLEVDIWHYVKRQRAWFKRREGVHLITVKK